MMPAPASVTMPAPAPVAMPAAPPIMGSVTQVKANAVTFMDREHAVVSQHHTATSAVKEIGQTQYAAGESYEVEAAAQHFNIDQQQTVMGATQTQTVEIPTVQEVVMVQ